MPPVARRLAEEPAGGGAVHCPTAPAGGEGRPWERAWGAGRVAAVAVAEPPRPLPHRAPYGHGPGAGTGHARCR
jgi:hypothetical protein